MIVAALCERRFFKTAAVIDRRYRTENSPSAKSKCERLAKNLLLSLELCIIERYMKLSSVLIYFGALLLWCGCDSSSRKADQAVISSKPVKEIAAKNATSECASLEGQVVVLCGKVTYIRIVHVGCGIELDDKQTCSFTRNSNKSVAALKMGDFVRVKGRVSIVVPSLGVSLEHCVLVNKNQTN
jgi:hypothetical protein